MAFNAQDMSSSTFQQTKSGDSRAKFPDAVPREVKRFIWSTSPHKCWADYLVGKSITSALLTQKFDGWFAVVYVSDGEVHWQTTSGFVHSAIEIKMKRFKTFLETLIRAEKLQSTHAFKVEVVVQDQHKVQHLHLVGKKFDPAIYSYKIVITDFFVPYTAEMDKSLGEFLKKQHASSLKHKTAPLTAHSWLDVFCFHQKNIQTRLNNARLLLCSSGTQDLHPDIDDLVIIASVHNMTENGPISGRNLIVWMSQFITKHPMEGMVLHCVINQEPTIYKVKLEYMGGLGFFYTPAMDASIRDWNQSRQVRGLPDVVQCAGRQFVVRCLTAECIYGTHIPYKLGVGYWDDHMFSWVVTDCIKVKYAGGKRKGDTQDPSPYPGQRYLDTSEGKFFVDKSGNQQPKHAGVTMQTQSIANQIAKVLDMAQPTTDTSNLFLTDRFKKEASENLLNISEMGLIVGGSANMVFSSSKNNYHMQAVVLKCMGMSNRGSAHAFTSAEVANAEQFTSVKVMPGSISNEWDKSTWANMSDLRIFNGSKLLTACLNTVALHQRLGEVNLFPHTAKPAFSKLTSLHGIHCSMHGLYEQEQTIVSTVVHRLGGTFTDDVSREITDASPIENKIDIVFVPKESDRFSLEILNEIKKKLKIQFLVARWSWAQKYTDEKLKDNTYTMPNISLYTVNYGPVGPDNTFIDDEHRFMWRRAFDRINTAPVEPVASPEIPISSMPESHPSSPIQYRTHESRQKRPLSPSSSLPEHSVPDTTVYLTEKLKYPLGTTNHVIHNVCDPSIFTEFLAETRKLLECLSDLGALVGPDYGSSVHVATRLPFFTDGTPTFNSFTHSRYFDVLLQVRNIFQRHLAKGRPVSTMDYKLDQWKEGFLFSWNGDEWLQHSTHNTYATADAMLSAIMMETIQAMAIFDNECIKYDGVTATSSNSFALPG